MELILKYFPDLTPEQVGQFGQLQALYSDWNDRINVVSRKDIDQLYLHHVLHSLAIAHLVRFNPGSRVLDVGTGGGFPAVPLAILFPESRFTAIDTIGKKVGVVNAVVNALGLANVTAERVQASEVTGSFDFVVTRAVASLSTLLPWVWGKVAKVSSHALPNGVICLKGGDLRSETAEALRKMGLSPSQAHEYNITSFFPEPFFETKKILYVQR